MTSNKQIRREQQREQIKAARQWLAERFPAVFDEGGIPLAIGAHQQAHDAAAADPEAPPHWAIQTAFRRWVNHPRYWEGLAAKRTRRNLDGSEAGEVTDEQAKRAVKQLKEHRRQQAAKRKQQGGQQQSSEKTHQATEKVGRTGRPVLTLKGKRRQRRQGDGTQ
ncbi:ProQ/FINO family protein [Halorhodospira sp. 9622]|uniref:ProQ/FINO family protein n=1 Tax=Halorhodospira sp. 9622 TaxID=2899136 RepID=UPI001EE79FF9|nr:ProQ/FINO family protein [Halorhodospira sp. 9622]MCG5537388.1 ProQ/FinO family protein [Halorhodospira sp. 9622]